MQKAKQGTFENSTGFLYVTKLQTDCIEYRSSSPVRKISIHSEHTGKEKSMERYKNQTNPGIKHHMQV